MKVLALCGLSLSLYLSPGFAWGLSPLPSANAWAQTSPAKAVQPMRLVILPFKNITRQPEDEWMSESFSENLTMSLVQTPHLQLVERTQIHSILKEQSFSQSAFVEAETAPQLGKILGAHKVLLGNYQKIGNTLVINTRVVDVETGKIDPQLATQLKGNPQQVLALQQQLAQHLVSDFQQQFQQVEALRLRPQITGSEAAFEEYQRAIQWARLDNDQSLRQAIASLEQALSQDPQFALASVRLSELLSRRAQNTSRFPSSASDDVSRAIELANQALALKADPGPVYRALASAYFAQGEREKALLAIREALQLLPGDTDTVLAYLRYQPAVDLNTQQQTLQNLGADLQDPWIQLALASQAVEAAKRERYPHVAPIEALLAQAGEQLTGHPLVPLKLAELKVIERDYEQAKNLLTQALSKDSENFLLYYLAAQVILYGPDQTQAQRWLERSIQLNPQFGYNTMTLGYLHWRNDRHAEALAHFQRAEQVFPESSALAFVRGKYYFAQRNFVKARQHLQQALNLWGKDRSEQISKGAIYVKLGDIEADAGRWSEALQFYQQATEEERPIQAQAFLKISQAQARAGQYVAAQQSFKTYLELADYRSPDLVARDQQNLYLLQQTELRPDDPALLNDLGMLALLSQDYAVAETYLQQALAKAPQHPAILYNDGLLKLYREQWSAAIARFQQVLQFESTHEKARYNLGVAYLRSQQPALARQAWQQLLQQDPQHPRAREALQQLGQTRGL